MCSSVGDAEKILTAHLLGDKAIGLTARRWQGGKGDIPTAALREVGEEGILENKDTEGQYSWVGVFAPHLALKRPNLLKAVSLLSWPEHVRRPHKVRPLHTGSSLALTWPSGVAGTFRFEVTRLQFLFVYLANSIFIQIILGFGVDVSRQG